MGNSTAADGKSDVGIGIGGQAAAFAVISLEPVRRYRERLSNLFESIRTLHAELGVLAQSFEAYGVTEPR